MDKVEKAIWELYEKGEIDILTFRYYTRLMYLADNVLLAGGREVDLAEIGEKLLAERISHGV